VSYTSYDQYLKSEQLAVVKRHVARRSGGTCELCRRAKATEFHHVRYCRWGEYDPPENLVHVCHECHCDCHRCRNCGKVTLKAAEIKQHTKLCRKCREAI
jgi:hypothetical protein